MAKHDDELKPGFLTRALSSPFISIPFAVASGVGAGLTPATARATSGIHTGLSIGLAAEASKFKRQQRQRLSQAIIGQAQTGLIDAFERPKTIKDLRAEIESVPGGKLRPGQTIRDFVDPSQTRPQQRTAREQRLGSLIQGIAPVDPAQARELLGTELSRVPKALTPFGGAKTGFHTIDAQGNVRQVVSPAPGTAGTSSLFTKPSLPSTRFFTRDSIARWEQSVTPQLPLGDRKLLVPIKKPVTLTEPMALTIEAKVRENRPLTNRELTAIGANNQQQVKQIMEQRRAIRTEQTVSEAQEREQAIFDQQLTRPTGDESRIYRVSPETGELQDAVTENVPEGVALSAGVGWRKLSPDQVRTVTQGKATLDALDQFEELAKKVLAKEPGIWNMGWQRFNLWARQFASDTDVVLFQTQMFRTLPQMIQSMGLSGARTGFRLLEFEKAALPNSGMTVGTALEIIQRDRQTVEAVRRAAVKGESHFLLPTQQGATTERATETDAEYRERVGLPPKQQ